MKNASLVISVISLIAAITFGVLFLTNGNKNAEAPVEGEATEVTASKGDIVYIDLDRIIMDYDMANDLRSVVETKVQSIQAEITRRENNLTSAVNKYQEKMEKGLMTRSTAEYEAQKIQNQEIEYQNYANQKNNEINEELLVMNNQINDAIASFIAKYNKEKQYAMILLSQGDADDDGIVNLGTPVLTADPSLDITNDVLAGLNAEYIASKNANSKK